MNNIVRINNRLIADIVKILRWMKKKELYGRKGEGRKVGGVEF